MSKKDNVMKSRKCKSGLHLFNRDNGLNILLDEIDVPKKNWARAPRHVSIALTNVCDLSCPHCYAPKNSQSIEVHSVISWLNELDSNGCFGVGFGGGEPTLYDNLMEVLEYGMNKTKLAMTMTTHGHHLEEDFAKEIGDYLHFVRFSMDGIGKTYEKIRNRSFAGLLNNIRTIKQYSSFGINYVVNERTLSDLDDGIELSTRLGAQQFLLLPEVSVGRSTGIDSEIKNELLDWVNNYSGAVPLAISKEQSNGFPYCEPTSTEDELFEHAHIDASGTLKKTSYEPQGVQINDRGVMKALPQLRKTQFHKKEES